jgi:hypothetical protein
MRLTRLAATAAAAVVFALLAVVPAAAATPQLTRIARDGGSFASDGTKYFIAVIGPSARLRVFHVTAGKVRRHTLSPPCALDAINGVVAAAAGRAIVQCVGGEQHLIRLRDGVSDDRFRGGPQPAFAYAYSRLGKAWAQGFRTCPGGGSCLAFFNLANAESFFRPLSGAAFNLDDAAAPRELVPCASRTGTSDTYAYPYRLTEGHRRLTLHDCRSSKTRVLQRGGWDDALVAGGVVTWSDGLLGRYSYAYIPGKPRYRWNVAGSRGAVFHTSRAVFITNVTESGDLYYRGDVYAAVIR